MERRHAAGQTPTKIVLRCYLLNFCVGLALSLSGILPTATEAGDEFRAASESQAANVEPRLEQELEQQKARVEEHPEVLSSRDASSSDQLLRLPVESPCFVLSALSWEGKQPPERLMRTTEMLIGQCVGEDGLRMLQAHLSSQLIYKGLITSRILIPEQSLAAGKLTLHYLPRRIVSVDSGVGAWSARMACGTVRAFGHSRTSRQ